MMTSSVFTKRNVAQESGKIATRIYGYLCFLLIALLLGCGNKPETRPYGSVDFGEVLHASSGKVWDVIYLKGEKAGYSRTKWEPHNELEGHIQWERNKFLTFEGATSDGYFTSIEDSAGQIRRCAWDVFDVNNGYRNVHWTARRRNGLSLIHI